MQGLPPARIQQYSQHPGQHYYCPEHLHQTQHLHPRQHSHSHRHDYAQPEEHTVWNRPTTDPNYYDQLFNSQTRALYDDDTHHAKNRRETPLNRDAARKQVSDINYHLFAPKYENHADSNGYQDTWIPEVNLRKSQLPSTATKRGSDRVAFPARTAPTPNERVSHALEHRQPEYVSPYQSKTQQIDNFNRGIDSLHLPEDMQRPVATRDMIKKQVDDQRHSSDYQKTNTRSSKKLDNNPISDRQFTMEAAIPFGTATAGSFEDMFY